MSGHTEGPWLCQPTDFDGPDYGVGIVGDNLGGLVGYALPWSTEIDSRDYSRVEANARLIAAAPQLLEALVLCGDSHEICKAMDDATYALVQAAIDKARGQS